MGEVRYITYSKEEENIVKSGSSAIRKVLLGAETNKKLSLLFCLDKFKIKPNLSEQGVLILAGSVILSLFSVYFLDASTTVFSTYPSLLNNSCMPLMAFWYT